VIDAVSVVDARSRAVRRDELSTRHRDELHETKTTKRSRSTAVSEVRLSAETRTEFGKGGARRTRRAGKVPAVIYGHGAEPRHVALPAREFANAIRHGGANVLLTLDLEGGEELAIPKSIQRHPIKGYYEHVDLLAVRRGEKVTIDLPVHVTGDVVPGGLLNQEHTTVSVEAEATHLPEGVEVNVEGLSVGHQVTAGDLALPSGVTLSTDAETVVLIIAEAPSAEQLDAKVAEAAGELGIVEDAPSAESETPAEESAPAEASAE
jgi:large subunit ribosomal protein L25